MDYVARTQKWGDTEFGTESGEVTWGADLSSGLQTTNGTDQADFQEALQDAFDAWEEVSGLNFTYVGSADADIDVAMGYGDGERSGTVGYASWNGGSTITSGTVTFDDQETWAPTGDGGIDFYAVALHEIGHVIGLSHFNGSTQIMNSSISADDLRPGDIAGAQYLYGTGGLIVPDEPFVPDEPDEPIIPDIPDAPDEPVTPYEPDAPPVASDDGGSSSAVGAMIGLLALVFGMIFGGGGGLVALAAGQVADDDEDPSEPEAAEDDALLSNLIPIMETESHAVYVDDFGNFVEGPDDHDHDHEELFLF